MSSGSASSSRTAAFSEALDVADLADLADLESASDSSAAPGPRCFTMRRIPISTVAAVVPAIIGKLSMSGVPIARPLESMSLPSGSPDAVSTTSGTANAIASGGCTMGPKRLLRWTAVIAPSAPTT